MNSDDLKRFITFIYSEVISLTMGSGSRYNYFNSNNILLLHKYDSLDVLTEKFIEPVIHIHYKECTASLTTKKDYS
ncbi:hypothetical protein EAH77_06015 [Ewingella americana]|uniref:Uncharacterized protein n=1 Tax=Ewingella americana TaxID=41202 RepID=A0A502GLF7_9GAMM|nr:hypothetical protein EAH77_06015 [Ewingella americana]